MTDWSDRFRKVARLCQQGSTEGERKAAQAALDRMLNALPAVDPPERVWRDADELARYEAVIARHGTEDALFAETKREAALRAATRHLVVWDDEPGREGVYRMAGWGLLGTGSNMPLPLRTAVTEGWPVPPTVAGLWEEYDAAKALEADRDFAADGFHQPDLWMIARSYALEGLLDTVPSRSRADMLARQSWMEWLVERGWTRDVREDARLLLTLRGDIERLARSASATST